MHHLNQFSEADLQNFEQQLQEMEYANSQNLYSTDQTPDATPFNAQGGFGLLTQNFGASPFSPMFSAFTPVDKSTCNTAALPKQEPSPIKMDSINDSLELIEIEQNLKKEILDESGYKSDHNNSQTAFTPADFLSENEDEQDTKLDQIGTLIQEQKR